VAAGATAVPLVVVGAHRKGQPLAPQLEELGAAWDGPVRTAARYRMVALDTVPPKPGVYRSEDGAELVGEKWLLSPAAMGTFLASLPEPMLLGSVRLADGSTAVGFACDAVAAAGGEDITAWGDWLADRSVEPKPRTVWRDLGEAALAGFSRGERG
jgi:allophanate hydrolase